MPKGRTRKVAEIKQNLIDRIASGYYQSGDRFFSNRAIAARFHISYMTAHRLLKELEEEGYLGRKAQSGSFVKGEHHTYDAVGLYVSERAQIKTSYSAFLLHKLVLRLEAVDLPHKIVWTDRNTVLEDDLYPVMIDTGYLQMQLYRQNMFGFLLNQKAAPGLSSIWVDSVYIDNYSGGTAAAQIFKEYLSLDACRVFAGPEDDERSGARVSGFLSELPDAQVVSAGTWHFEEALRHVPTLFETEVKKEKCAVFCCNDKLASAVIHYCSDSGIAPPFIMGFDNMPVSEELNFSTIAVPWDEMVERTVECCVSRLGGDGSSTRHIVLNTKPLLRGLSLRH